MITTEIPLRDWARSLDEFSEVHDGWLVSLDLLSAELGAQPQIHDLPLRGVTAEMNREHPSIIVSAAHADGEHVSHVIHDPTHVRIERTDEHADVALQIESADGTVNILRFRTPALPEAVDGLPLGH